jgi:hypothetical membrane protein
LELVKKEKNMNTTKGSSYGKNRRTAIMDRYLSITGILGPVLYTVIWLVLGFLDSTYSHTRDPISNLSAIGAPLAWLMTVVILIFALLLIVFAYALHRGLPLGSWVGPTVLGLAGVGYVGIAFAPLNLANLEDPNLLHTISASVTVFALMLAPVLVFPRLRLDPGWKNLSWYSIATTVAAFAFAFLASLTTFAGWEGLMQRLVTVVTLLWIVVMAIRLNARLQP